MGPPWEWKDIRWGMGGYITVVHFLAIVGLFKMANCTTTTLWWSLLLWPISGFCITGGVHRLWAHRSYKANSTFRFFTMLANSIANQGTIYHWARDHRTHHFHSETCADPHDAIRGFWFAHIGWLYLKKDPRVAEAGRKVNVDDLKADGGVMLQLPWIRGGTSSGASSSRRSSPGCSGESRSGMASSCRAACATSTCCTARGWSTRRRTCGATTRTTRTATPPRTSLLRWLRSARAGTTGTTSTLSTTPRPSTASRPSSIPRR